MAYELTPLVKIVIGVFSLILFSYVLFAVALPFFGIDIFKLVGVQPQSIYRAGTAASEVPETPGLLGDFDYTGFVNPDGGLNWQEMADQFNQRPLFENGTSCNTCSSCNAATGECDTCDSCQTPGGQVTAPQAWSTCYDCVGTSCKTCASGENKADLPDICRQIKQCIATYPGDDTGCELYVDIPRASGTQFGINAFRQIVNSCRNLGPVTIEEAAGITKEICNLDTSSITTRRVEHPTTFYQTQNQCIYWTPHQDDNPPQLHIEEAQEIGTPSNGESTQCFPCKTGAAGCAPVQPWTSFFPLFNISDSDLFVATNFFDGDNERDVYFYNAQNEYGDPDCTAANLFPKPENPTFLAQYHIKYKNGDTNPASVAWLPTQGFQQSVNRVCARSIGDPTASHFDRLRVSIESRDNIENGAYGMRYSDCNPDYGTANTIFWDDISYGAKISSTNTGHIKIKLSKLNTETQNCQFNINVCSQDSFSDTTQSGIIELLDFFRQFNPLNFYTVTDNNDDQGLLFSNTYARVYHWQIIEYNPFRFQLDKDYTVDEIKTAIQTGFREWSDSVFPAVSEEIGVEWLSKNNNAGLILP